jgi:hypothetical protein
MNDDTAKDGSNGAENRDRGVDGRFGRGNRFAKGNSVHQKMHELRKCLLECVTPEQIARVMKTLYEAAVGGDIAACRVFLEYSCGKPSQPVELTPGVDTDVVVKVLREGLWEAL